MALLGLAALILLASGGIPLLTSGRKRARRKELKQAAKGTQAAATTGSTVALTAARGDQATTSAGAAVGKPAKRGADHDDLDSDVAEILRRRGIS